MFACCEPLLFLLCRKHHYSFSKVLQLFLHFSCNAATYSNQSGFRKLQGLYKEKALVFRHYISSFFAYYCSFVLFIFLLRLVLFLFISIAPGKLLSGLCPRYYCEGLCRFPVPPCFFLFGCTVESDLVLIVMLVCTRIYFRYFS